MSIKRAISEKATISSNLREFRPRHAQNGAVKKDVLAAGQVGVKASAHFEQAANPAADQCPAGGRADDPRKDLQQRALTGPVPPDNADGLAGLDVETHVAQGPDEVVLAAVFAQQSQPANVCAERLRQGARPGARRDDDASDLVTLAKLIDDNRRRARFAHFLRLHGCRAHGDRITVSLRAP